MFLLLSMIILLCVFVFTNTNVFTNKSILLEPYQSDYLGKLEEKGFEKNAFDNFDRFHFQFYEQNDFKKIITQLKDAHSDYLPYATNKPIRSIRLRARPNDNARFTQHFSLLIFLKRDPNKVVEFRFSKYSGYIDHKIPDTSKDSLEWMNSLDDKMIIFTTQIYNPMLDILPFYDSKLKPLQQDFWMTQSH